VRIASEALHTALAKDDEDALTRCVPHARPIRSYIAAELFDTAERRMREFEVARVTARAKKELEAALEAADGPGGSSILQEALRHAEEASLQGLLVRKAQAKVKALLEAEEAAEREAEALAYLERAEVAKREAAERKRLEEEAKEAEKAAKKAEREAERAAKKEEEKKALGDDVLSRAVAAQAWDTHTAPDGRKYYHNPLTNVTTWDLPEEMRELQLREAASSFQGAKLSRGGSAQQIAQHVQQFGNKLQQAALVTRSGKHADGDGGAPAEDPSGLSAKQLKKFCAARNVEIPDGASVDQVRQLAIANKHLATVTWQRTKAPDGRYYYYNPKTKQTSWTNPEPILVSGGI